MVKSIGGMWFVCCIEVVHISEGPLSEVSLHMHQCVLIKLLVHVYRSVGSTTTAREMKPKVHFDGVKPN